jgi:GntR family transcriptional regulator, galactonate operon transcriptional repressor
MMNWDFRVFHPPGQRRRNLFAQTVDLLGGRIVGGDFKPGDTLPNEAELCRILGASRSVVREAVKSLASKGLLESRTRIGTRVLPSAHWNLLDVDVLGWRYASMPRPQFFRELFEIRRMIEPQAAALAAERAVDTDIEAIANAYREMQAAEHDSEAAIDADIRFHRAILAAGHNDLLLQMGALISAGLLVSFRISSESFDAVLPQHGRVLDAIRRRNAEVARAEMDRLITETRDFLERELADSLKKEMPAARARPAFDQELAERAYARKS